MRLQQTSLDQTGVAILNLDGEEKHIPLFSLSPVEEIHEFVRENYPSYDEFIIKAVYFTNNLMKFKIEDLILEYRETHNNLPENYVEELLSGFPYIIGINTFSMFLYA